MKSRDESTNESAFDKERLHYLASAVLEGTASESELSTLTELLRESPSARDEYLKLVDLHAVLSTQPVSIIPETRSDATEPSSQSAHSHFKWVPALAAAALAASLLIMVPWFLPDQQTTDVESFALIAQGADLEWESEEVALGDRIGATDLRLRSGIVRLEFDSGVEVTLEGPAELKLISVSETSLLSGMLTATVPPGAEGFVVDTPSAQVIDLGTSFGIDIGNDGFSSVSVFDGEVEVAPHDAARKRLLTEGESVRIGADYEVEEIDLDPKQFEKMWPTASGIAGSSDSVSLVPPWPKQIRFVQSDDEIFIRPEGQSVRLKSELIVNISEPSEYSSVDDLTPATLEANRFVRSYILHYSPASQLGPRRAKRVVGSITFARPVLGLMVNHEELAASSRRFGRRGAGEGNQRRELNLTGDEITDRVALSEDRKTLTLDLVAPGRSSDLVRVIVEGSRKHNRPRQRSGSF